MVRIIVSGHFLTIPLQDLFPWVLDEIKSLSTFQFKENLKSGGITVNPVPMYEVADGRIYLGIGYLESVQSLLVRTAIPFTVIRDIHPAERRADSNRFSVDWLAMSEKLSLRTFQPEALAIMERHDRGIIQAPPAFGKSFLFTAYALAHPRAKIHIVSESISILGRIYRELSKHMLVGMVGDSRKDFARVTLVSAYSLDRIEFEDPTSDRFADVVLADEVSQLAAPSIFSKLSRYRYNRMYGFDADPYCRFDGAHGALESIFGKVIFSRTYHDCQRAGIVSPIEVEWIPLEGPDITSHLKERTAIIRRGIWRNEIRNRLIIDKVNSLPQDEQCLILCSTIDHLLCLKKMDPDLLIVYAGNGMDKDRYTNLVLAGILDKDRDPIISNSLLQDYARAFESGEIKRVAANSVWDTGVSFEMLRHLFVAHGMRSRRAALQGPGRVSRIHNASGKSVGKVYDINDIWNSTFQKNSSERGKVYACHQWGQSGSVPQSRR